jgi:acetyl esterase
MIAGKPDRASGGPRPHDRRPAARLYVPHDPSPSLLLFFHGGGWVVGDLESHDAPCRALAKVAGMRVVSFDYRLSPEHPWPTPVADAVQAYERHQRERLELRIDPARIAVGGDSAGGHLAAMVALRTDAAFQAPRLSRDGLHEDVPLGRPLRRRLPAHQAQHGLVRGAVRAGRADKRAASPLHAGNLREAPPAYVVTGGFDPLRDEGEAYARALQEAGVRTTLRRYPGQVHGFLNMTALESTRTAIAEMAGALRASV